MSAPPASSHGIIPYQQPHYRTGRSAASRLPEKVLERIFSYVCPHSLDRSYRSAEEAATEAGCMLCDMRDLARCRVVCKTWCTVAEQLLYTSIRLDSVHYCGLEDELQKRRNRGSFLKKKHEPPMEVPEMRMRLLYRTFQENERIAFTVQFFKMPYMTRETCRADLARLVSLTPELKYCDVPEGLFSDDSSCAGLKAILYARCPELRKMTWNTGCEKNFVDLWAQPPWRNLEVVILSSLHVENADLVRVLNSLPALHDLTLKSLPWISDAVFDATPNPFGIFPALSKLSIEDISSISLDGLKVYLQRPIIAASLTELTLISTSIPASSISELLAAAPSLESLTFNTTISRILPAPEPPRLKSRTLRTLRYELTPDAATKSLSSPTPSYYSHLAISLLSGGLPSLTTLYVRDPTFSERLAGHHSTLTHPLTIHTKSQDHLDWNNQLLKAVEWGNEDLLAPPTPGFVAQERPRSRGGEPPAWVKGHGRSGSVSSFSSVGLAPPSPGFAKKERRGSRQDIWR
ncbi:hypothetical protein FN846DRAFT_899721 [Sphaerosporella brunnea]|uniref:Uncharacterized protein n=1 Tax=Sphaerosporella brunnea TaxID=1250544 RepID=A0A5J5ERJ0_9PEZI|nr:hypothetical protein FN846DRAFT_899721 [Sphaerosporella brunnea]